MHVAPGTRFGPYEVTAPLGAGGMGEVYRANDTRLAREVALKILPKHFLDDDAARARFDREARAIAALSHPNVLTIFDFGSSDGTPFIITELLEGETLRQRLAKGPLPWRKAASIAAAAAEGLAAAHSKGLIHRDLKPENLFLTRDGRVKILDFGLAKPFDVPQGSTAEDNIPTPVWQSEVGRIAGTLGYLAPEQLRGEAADGRSDIFALGCVLYEMLTGRNPFYRGSGVDTLTSILRDDPSEQPVLLGAAPTEMLQVLRRCLEKNRDERFQSAQDLAFALRSFGSSATFPTVSGRKRARLRWIIGASLLLVAAVAAFVAYRGRTVRPVDALAVLPFLNQNTASSDDEYLADGLTESLIQSLSRLPRMSVMSSSSVFRYKGKPVDVRTAGEELKVDAVLLGRIQRRAGTVHVSAELVDTRNGRLLWGQQYETPLADVMTLQNRIAAEMSEELRVQLSGNEKSKLSRRATADAEAYQAYLKGRFYWNKRTPEGFDKAVTHFQTAIARDPNYALAWSGLADTYILQALYGQKQPAEVLPRARAAALQALQHDPELPEARTSLAYLYRNEDGDLARSSREFRRALAANPSYATAHHWYSLCLADLGETEAAVAEIKRAAQLDPLSPVIYADYAGILNDAGRSDEAVTQIEKALELDPNLPFAHHIYAEIHLRRRDAARAIAEASKAWESGHDPRALLRLAQGYVMAGRTADARDLLQELEKLSQQRYVSPYIAARLAMVVGDREKALTSLEEAVRVLPAGALRRSLESDKLIDPLRSDPRYAKALAALAARS